MKLTGAAILVSRGMTVLQAAPAAYPYRSALKAQASEGAVDWFELQHPSECYSPALYRLRLVSAEGQPIPIPTLVDGPDPSGVIDIGEGGNFENRRYQIISGVERCYGHSAGNLFRYLCQFTRLQEVYPGCRLQYTFRPAASKAEAEDWEAEAIKEYIIRRGQLPILNRELPRAYDDEVWNSVWERVFGPVTDAPMGEPHAPNRYMASEVNPRSFYGNG